MTVFEDMCVGCTSLGLPCLGRACPRRRVEVHYCDQCGDELPTTQWTDNEVELCEYCADEAGEDV